VCRTARTSTRFGRWWLALLASTDVADGLTFLRGWRFPFITGISLAGIALLTADVTSWAASTRLCRWKPPRQPRRRKRRPDMTSRTRWSRMPHLCLNTELYLRKQHLQDKVFKWSSSFFPTLICVLLIGNWYVFTSPIVSRDLPEVSVGVILLVSEASRAVHKTLLNKQSVTNNSKTQLATSSKSCH